MATRLLNPRDQLKARPATPGEYEAAAVRRARAVGREVIEDPRTLSAYVNYGRWLADCPHCAAGIAIHPEWALAACLGCYRVFRAIDVPRDWSAIEDLLVVRPEAHQHWLSSSARTRLFLGRAASIAMSSERATELLAENIAHGLEKAR